MDDYVFGLKVKGERWQGQMPVALLVHLRGLEVLLHRHARQAWRDELDRKAVPKGFEAATKRMVAIKKSSSAIEAAYAQPDYAVYGREPMDHVLSLVISDDDADVSPELAQWVHEAILMLDVDPANDKVFVSSQRGNDVEVSESALRRLEEVGAGSAKRAERTVSMVVRPSVVDYEALTVAGTIREGRARRKFQVTADVLREAGEVASRNHLQGDDLLVRFGGVERYDDAGAVTDVTTVDTVGGPGMHARMREFEEMEDGWLGDGQGGAPTKKLLQFAERALWAMLEAVPLDRPFIYPTERGGVHAEWDLEDGTVGVRMRLAKQNLLFIGEAEWDDGESFLDETRDEKAVVAWLRAVTNPDTRDEVADHE